MKKLTDLSGKRRMIEVVVVLTLFAALTFGQNLVVSGSGSFSGSGVINVKGNINTSGASAAVAFPGTVNLNGDAIQQVGISGNSLTFDTLRALGTSAKQLDVNVTVSDALDVNITGALNLDIQGTTLTLGGASYLLSGSVDVSDPACIVIYNRNAGSQSMMGLDYVGSVTLSGNAAKDLSGVVNVAGAFTHSGGNLTVNHNMTVSAANPAFATIADVTGNSTLALSGGTAKTINIINGISSGSAITNTGAAGLLTVQTLAGNSGTINGGTGGVTFALAAVNGGNIDGGAGAVTFDSTLAQSAGTITAGTGGVVFNGTPTISGGSVTAGNGASLDFNTDITNNGTISLTGTGSAAFFGDFTSVGTLSFANTSNTTFDGATQIIPVAT
jgi:fibronectin-binding autotransporter adhesin